jgi:hypothetical protein
MSASRLLDHSDLVTEGYVGFRCSRDEALFVYKLRGVGPYAKGGQRV